MKLAASWMSVRDGEITLFADTRYFGRLKYETDDDKARVNELIEIVNGTAKDGDYHAGI